MGKNKEKTIQGTHSSQQCEKQQRKYKQHKNRGAITPPEVCNSSMLEAKDELSKVSEKMYFLTGPTKK